MKQDKKNLRKVHIRLLPSTMALITQGREYFAPLCNIFKNTKIWEGETAIFSPIRQIRVQQSHIVAVIEYFRLAADAVRHWDSYQITHFYKHSVCVLYICA